MFLVLYFFFFKQKTSYEMRISDWSSDVALPISFAHLPGWRAVPGVEVVGICTSRRETAEAAAARCHVERPFWDAEAMAADPDIDIIDCGTRPNIRHAMVLAALRNGKHVYNGIPFAADLEQARQLRDAWRASGK